MSTTRHVRPRCRVFLVAFLMATVLGSGTAQAHYNEEYREGWFNRDPELCTWGQMGQNHGYHTVTTSAWAGCANPKNTWFTQYQEYYKTTTWGAPGTYCGYRGWDQSPTGDRSSWHRLFDWDIWHMPCNYGAGVHVWISIDSWQYAWTDSRGYLGGARRPFTKHCHCP